MIRDPYDKSVVAYKTWGMANSKFGSGYYPPGNEESKKKGATELSSTVAKDSSKDSSIPFKHILA